MPTPEFVLRLREKIGHDPLWMPGVTAVVFRDDEILLVQRSDNGRWSPVTGIVDPGEHPAIAAVREVQEETGVVAEVDVLAWVNVTAPVIHVNGDHARYLDHTFRCRYISGEAHVGDDESTAVGWFPVGDLPPMSPVLSERILVALHHRGRPGSLTSGTSSSLMNLVQDSSRRSFTRHGCALSEPRDDSAWPGSGFSPLAAY